MPAATAASPHNRRKWERPVSIRGRVNGADVDYRIVTRLGDALIDESHDAEHQQHSSHNGHWCHECAFQPWRTTLTRERLILSGISPS
jgi:hypothetical protein